MSNKMLVLSVFDSEGAADTAVTALQQSKIAHGDAIGVLVLDSRGEVKADKVGKRSVGKGAAIGAVLAVVTPVGLGAALVSGALGAFHHKGLGLDAGDRDRLGKELEGGRAAIGVLAPVAEGDAVSARLTELGGSTEAHELADEDLAAVDAAATA
jgi:hypothetical protein